MSKIDQKYIESLELFTNALGEIVETLQQQNRNQEDAVNQFLAIPMNNLVDVVGELKKTNEKGFKELKNSNKEILKKIDNIKNQKNSGSFDKIEDPKNKDKIVDGIKIVVLIAAGVLALGMAFKIIGKVDFLSVMALSASIYIMSDVFAKMHNKLKGINFIDILKISLIIPVMALGILLSGYVLKNMPVISLNQGLSILFIGSTIGVASYLILNAIGKMSPKSLLVAPFIPFLLPLIALGLVLSSNILKGMQSIPFKTVINVAVVGLAMGIATFAITLALKNLKNVSWKEMLMLPIMLPLVALGIVLSSIILKGFQPVKDPLKLLIGSAVIGISLLIFSLPIMLLGRMKLKDVLLGAIMIVPLAYVIVKASEIFSDFVNVNDPLKLLIGSAVIGISLLIFSLPIMLLGKMKLKDVLLGTIMIVPLAYVIVKASEIFSKFVILSDPLNVVFSSLSIGISILVFTPSVMLLGKLNLKQLLIGTLGVVLVATAIVAVSYIFSLLPDKVKNPPIMWSLVSGISVLVFTPSVLFLGKLNPEQLLIGTLGVVLVAVAILLVSHIFSLLPGKMNFPIIKWVLEVGLGLLTFGLVSVAIDRFDKQIRKGLPTLLLLAGGILVTALILSLLPNNMKYPPFKWTLGVGLSLLEFGLMSIVAGLAALPIKKGLPILLLLSGTILLTALMFSLLPNDMKYPPFKWTLGVGLSLLAFGILSLAIGFLASTFSIMMLAGAGAMVALAGVIVLTSIILNTGNYDGNYPSLKWTLAVGVSLLGFAVVVALIGALVTTLNVIMLAGLGSMLILAESIVKVSHILDKGNYDGNYPSLKWTLAVGAALLAFSLLSVAAAAAGIVSAIGSLFTKGKDPLLKMAQTIVDVSNKLQEGNYNGNTPSEQWIDNITKMLSNFSSLVIKASGSGIVGAIGKLFGGGKNPLLTLTQTIIDVSKKIQEGKYDGNYPSEEWSLGVGNALLLFSESTSAIKKRGLESNLLALDTVVTSIINVSKRIGEGEYNNKNFPSKDWALGVGAVLTEFIGLTQLAGMQSLSGKIMSIFSGDNNPLMTMTKSIVAISKELTLGVYDGNMPSIKWALGVGALLTQFIGLTQLAGMQNLLGSLMAVFTGDNSPLMTMTKSIVAISKEITLGIYDGNMPSKEWTIGIGNVFTEFLRLTTLSGIQDMFSTFTSWVTGNDDPLMTLTKSIVNISKEISSGIYGNNYPDSLWVDGIYRVLKTHSEFLNNSSSLKVSKKEYNNILSLVSSIVNISKEISSGIYGNNYPDSLWVDGIYSVLKTHSEFLNNSSSLKVSKKEYNNILSLVSSIVNISKEISSGIYGNNYPDSLWVDGIYRVLKTHSEFLNNSSSLKVSKKEYNNILSLVSSIVTISKLFNNGIYDVYPSTRWILSVSNALLIFSKATEIISNNITDKILKKDPLKSLAQSMLGISKIMELSQWNSKIPSEEYTKSLLVYVERLQGVVDKWKIDSKDAISFNIGISNVSAGLKSISNVKPLSNDLSKGFSMFFDSLNKLPNLSENDSKIKTIKLLADNFTKMANSLSLVNKNLENLSINYNKLDFKKINDLKLSDNKSSLEIDNKENSNVSLKNETTKSDTKAEDSKSNVKNDDFDKRQENFYNDISAIRSLLMEFKDEINKPTKTGSFYK